VLALSTLAVALLLLAASAAAWHFAVANRSPAIVSAPPAEAAHFSTDVLPFTNLSGDSSQDYFADGITENLTTDLSRLSGSFVIARNTAFAFKGKGGRQGAWRSLRAGRFGAT
jgi:adenylate cyclase